jgi:hypothetical protein
MRPINEWKEIVSMNEEESFFDVGYLYVFGFFV